MKKGKINKDKKTKTLMSFKMDKDVKDKMHVFAERVGMPVSVMLNVMVKNTLRTGHLEVSLKLPTFKSQEDLDMQLIASMKSKLIPQEKSWLHKKMKELKVQEEFAYAGAI